MDSLRRDLFEFGKEAERVMARHGGCGGLGSVPTPRVAQSGSSDRSAVRSTNHSAPIVSAASVPQRG